MDHQVQFIATPQHEGLALDTGAGSVLAQEEALGFGPLGGLGYHVLYQVGDVGGQLPVQLQVGQRSVALVASVVGDT